MTGPTRRFTPPLGWPIHPRAVICEADWRPPLVKLNRYPRQVIGIAVRLRGNSYLSLLWSKPARWWVA